MSYDLNSKFDIEQHKKHFVNYLEVIIRQDGTVEYAVPSHQEKLIEIACSEKNLTREELSALCPEEYYFDFTHWLCIFTGCVSVWNDYILQGKRVNLFQRFKLIELQKAKLYRGELPW